MSYHRRINVYVRVLSGVLASVLTKEIGLIYFLVSGIWEQGDEENSIFFFNKSDPKSLIDTRQQFIWH